MNKELYALVCGVVRLSLTGQKLSPPVGEVAFALGKEETLRRLHEDDITTAIEGTHQELKAPM